MGHQLERCPLNQCARDFYSSVVTASCPSAPEKPWCSKISLKDNSTKTITLLMKASSSSSSLMEEDVS